MIILLLYFNALSYEDKITFEKIFHKYKNYMFAIALSYHKDSYDAEDIVQEACIRIMKNLSKIKNIESYETKGFISIITRNLAIDKYHKNKKEIAVDEEWPFDFEENFDFRIDDKEGLRYYLKKLKPDYLHILILTYVYDYDAKSISEILGISPENARKRKSRALESLRKHIKEGGDFYE